MNNILKKQKELLQLIASKHGGIHPIQNWGLQYHTKDIVLQYIKDTQFFLNEEIAEILIALGDGDKAIYKPWSVRHKELVSQTFESDAKIRSEAIDMLCFCLNICLAVGITPENIENEYNQVWHKNIDRQSGDY